MARPYKPPRRRSRRTGSKVSTRVDRMLSDLMGDSREPEIKNMKDKDAKRENLDFVKWISEEEASRLRNHGYKINPDYPTSLEMNFGLCSSSFITITEIIISKEKYSAIIDYLIGHDFLLKIQGTASTSFVNLQRRIVVILDRDASISMETSGGEDDAEDDAGYDAGYDSINIQFEPVESNKDFVLNLVDRSYEEFSNEYIPKKTNFYMIAQSQHGLYNQVTSCNPLPIKDNRYDLFYGKNFPHDKLLKFVTEETDNLMLLHGDPGTGKSNYIKNIITQSDKKVIYIPPSMLTIISSPDFISFMMGNKDSILLIEDAEEVLSTDRNAATNNLLGLTDGFLKDALNLKVIATFNCDAGKIDPALYRKGRLYFEYKFGKLTKNECNDLLEFVGIEREVDDDMNIAELFNPEDNNTSGDSMIKNGVMGFAAMTNPMLGS